MRANVSKSLAFALLVFLLSDARTALAEEPNFFKHFVWYELHAATDYKRNDFYIDYLNNCAIGLFSTRIGLRECTFLEPYFYGVAINDFLNQNWNQVDWNNNLAYGLGIRKRFDFSHLIKEHGEHLFLDCFAEKSWINYFPNDLFYLGHRPKDDIKFGAAVEGIFYTKPTDSKIEIKPIQFAFWSSIYYAKNSFYTRAHSGFYFGKLAFHVGPVARFSEHVVTSIYLFSRITYDMGTKEWNALDWHNNVRYGPGIDFILANVENYQKSNINLKLRLFGEFLCIRWAEKVLYVPSYRPTSDVQMGMTLSLTN